MKSCFFISFVSLALVPSIVLLVGCFREAVIEPMSKNHIEATGKMGRSTFHLADDGNLYRETSGGKKWTFHSKVFDPAQFKNAYVTEDQVTFRISDENGQRFKTERNFNDDFDDLPTGVDGLRRLVSKERNRWGSFTLQSPKAPSVQEYVELRKKILGSQSGFLDCKLEPIAEMSHSGNRSLQFMAPPKSSSMVTCKSSISCPLIYFKDGDDLWFEAWYWVQGEMPLTLVDFECEFVSEHPGIRVRFYDSGYLGAELKGLDKPQYRQHSETAIRFPKAEWVRVRVHLLLSPTEGLIEIWQNAQKVLKETGPTLPFRSAVYNSLEVGISAYSELQGTSILFVDDVRLSDVPIEDKK